MTGYDSDSSLQLSGNALKNMPARSSSDSDSFLNLNEDGAAWSFDPTDSNSLEVMITDESGTFVEEKSFDQPFVLIGRSPNCDLCLQDESISFRHAYLQRMYGRVLCVDLASRSGTYWDRHELPYGWFDERHPIRIGPYELRLNSSILEDEPEEPEFDPKAFFKTFSNQALLPTVSLQHLARSGPGESWTINRPITLVGSSPRCRLKVSDKTVSKVHCSLLLMPDGLWVVDLLGKGGTFVDGQSIRHMRIPNGSTLRVGRFTFRISYEANSTQQLAPLTNEPAALRKTTSGVSEEFVLKLMQQVTNMQQQFLMQSQQQTEMMLQFFGTMHANQHELLREEMARLHEINREMHELKQQLDQPPKNSETKWLALLGKKSAGTAESKAAQSVAEESTRHEAESLRQQFEQLRHQLIRARASAESSSTQEEADLVDETNWRLQKAAELDRSAIDLILPEEAIEPETSSSNLETEILEPEIAQNPPLEQAAEQEEQQDAPEQDHHAWVLDRMHKLERERKGLFRKVLRSLFASND